MVNVGNIIMNCGRFFFDNVWWKSNFVKLLFLFLDEVLVWLKLVVMFIV